LGEFTDSPNEGKGQTVRPTWRETFVTDESQVSGLRL
jgi:hypothetical protein